MLYSIQYIYTMDFKVCAALAEMFTVFVRSSLGAANHRRSFGRNLPDCRGGVEL